LLLLLLLLFLANDVLLVRAITPVTKTYSVQT
jgi:hypothetical protein